MSAAVMRGIGDPSVLQYETDFPRPVRYVHLCPAHLQCMDITCLHERRWFHLGANQLLHGVFADIIQLTLLRSSPSKHMQTPTALMLVLQHTGGLVRC
jgi:hypothetical protein